MLKKIIAQAAKVGYTMKAGMETEFFNVAQKFGLSADALHNIGGLLRHARGFTAITNPLVNSYKRSWKRTT